MSEPLNSLYLWNNEEGFDGQTEPAPLSFKIPLIADKRCKGIILHKG